LNSGAEHNPSRYDLNFVDTFTEDIGIGPLQSWTGLFQKFKKKLD
jgi:hypothetical protein